MLIQRSLEQARPLHGQVEARMFSVKSWRNKKANCMGVGLPLAKCWFKPLRNVENLLPRDVS